MLIRTQAQAPNADTINNNWIDKNTVSKILKFFSPELNRI